MRSCSRTCFHGASALEQLMALAGMIHYLHSAVAVAQDGNVLFDATDNARWPSNNPMQERPTSSGARRRPLTERNIENSTNNCVRSSPVVLFGSFEVIQ